MADFIELKGEFINLDSYKKIIKSTYKVPIPATICFDSYPSIELKPKHDGFFVSNDIIIYETEEQRDADFEKILNHKI